MTYIYALIDPTTDECKYIGKANHPDTRLRKHLNGIDKECTPKSCWMRRLRKQGISPIMLVLDKVPRGEWAWYEQWWISYMKSLGARLTNSTEGGDGGKGLKHSVESKKKLSEHAKKRTGPANPNFGNTLPKEARERISASRRGTTTSDATKRKISETLLRKYKDDQEFIDKVRRSRKPFTEATRAKIAASSTGRKKTDETKRKHSIALKGRVRSAEHCANISKARKGIVPGDEARAKLSAALTGRVFTPEHKKKLSDNKKAYWEARRASMDETHKK